MSYKHKPIDGNSGSVNQGSRVAVLGAPRGRGAGLGTCVTLASLTAKRTQLLLHGLTARPDHMLRTSDLSHAARLLSSQRPLGVSPEEAETHTLAEPTLAFFQLAPISQVQ